MNIELTNKKGDVLAYAIVSPEDYENVSKHTWCRRVDSNNGKLYVMCAKLKLSLHQFILGKAPEEQVIDHIDGNALNNSRENLRFASKEQNAQNSNRTFEDKSSSYLGVHKKSKKNSWIAKSGDKYLGSFQTEKDAAECFDRYTLIKYGPLAKTNNLIDYETVKDLTLADITEAATVEPIINKSLFLFIILINLKTI